MKRTATLVVALALAVVAYADETYEVTLPTVEVNRLDRGRTQHNEDVCSAAALGSGCSQDDACVALGAPCGASCSDADAVTNECRIYSGTPGEREDFVADQMFAEALEDYDDRQAYRDRATFEEWCKTASGGDLTSLCAIIPGLPPDCKLCGP